MKTARSMLSSDRHRRRDQPPTWLEAVYAAKRQRTVELTRQAIAALKQGHQRVSLATIVSMTKQLDPDGKGLSESALLNNTEARLCYEQNRSWRGSKPARRRPNKGTIAPQAIKADRDPSQARRRLEKLSKSELVERLLSLEQRYAELQQQWLQAQDALLASALAPGRPATKGRENKRRPE